jgi:cytoplasmic iron level regulating protein YaaA (DUF328/UPF0246 family)
VASGAPLLLLLPPSEGKSEAGGKPAWQPASGRFGQALGERRAAVAAALAAVGGGDEVLLGVGGKHLERARAANQTLVGAPSAPAARRYTGVVWDHLDLASLTPTQRRRASSSIAVVSGLLGVTGIDDPVPDYRIKMGASLPPLGKLSTWWRPAVSEVLAELARDAFVVDLLPNEHRAAWAPATGTVGVSVTFVERNGKVAGHDAKAAKGRLARHLLSSRAAPPAALRSWRDDRFDLDVRPIA